MSLWHFSHNLIFLQFAVIKKKVQTLLSFQTLSLFVVLRITKREAMVSHDWHGACPETGM